MLRKILIILLSLILVIAIIGYFYVHSMIKAPQPDYNQNVKLSGLSAKVTVKRDKWGMPHIYAQNLTDLYRVLGYVMAQDRLWHMDLIRRATEGRLSEIFGKDFVKTDLLLRSLQIPQKSEYLYSQIPDSVKQFLIAFSDGVNQFIHSTKALPVEFRILKYKPEDWTPINTINLVGFMAWDLTLGWNEDIYLWQALQKVDSIKFSQLVPRFDNRPVIYKEFKLPDSVKITNDLSRVAQQLDNLGIIAFTGSNNWAVGPQKSVYGKPILANDMHLGFGIPGIWYQVHLKVPGKLDVTGVTIPGAPGVVAGHNESIAWGMTNVMLDNVDFYIETINDDTSAYLLNGKWVPFKILNEKIITKDGDTVTKKLLFTHRGPVVSGFKGLKNKVISMSWGGYDSLSNELMGVIMLNFAHNWQEYNQAVRYFRAVAQNIVYADIYGNIGIHVGAGIPIRKGPAYLPFKGDTTLHDWKGWVSYDQLPYEFNPKRGFVASANNISAKNYPYYISKYFAAGYRYERIVQMLKAKDKLSTDDFKKMHTDWKSKLVEHTLPFINKQLATWKSDDKLVQQAKEQLRNWDGVMSTNGIAPMIFEEFYHQLIMTAISDELGYELAAKIAANKMISGQFFERLVKNQASAWADNVNTKQKEDYNWMMKTAFLRTVDTLKHVMGDELDDWRYANRHIFILQHPLGKVKILDMLFNLNRGPYKIGGSWHTVSPYSYHYGKKMEVYHGASQRHIFVVGDWDKGFMIIPTGNSGLPGNEFYCNQTEDYLKGVYRPDAFSDSAVEAVKKYQRQFVPKL